MERFRTLMVTTAMILAASNARGDGWSDFQSDVAAAIGSGQAESVLMQKPVLDTFDRAPDGWREYWSAYLHYRASLLTEALDARASVLESCIEHGQAVIDGEPADEQLLAETSALLGACHSSMAGTGPAAGFRHGPRAAMLRDEALLLAPDNPRVLTLAGIQDVWTPVQWGGSPERAERQLRDALEHFEQQTEQASWQPRWGRSDAIGHLAVALDRLDRSDEAQRVLDQARDEGLWNGWLDRIHKQLEQETSG